MYLLKYREDDKDRQIDFPSLESLISHIDKHKITDFEVNRTYHAAAESAS